MHPLVFEHGAWSASELEGQVGGWLWWLRERGLKTRARVGVLSWNRPELVALFHACGLAGLTLVPFNARLTRGELQPLIDAARPSLILTDLFPADVLEGAVPFPKGVSSPLASLPRPADDVPLAGLFTSGTTGVPRLIELTHGNFKASARASAANLGGGAEQRWSLCLPLFHVGGLAMAHRCAEYKAALVIERGFDPVRLNRQIDAGEVTHLSLVAHSLDRLLEQRSDRFPPSVRAILVGGGPVSERLLQRARGWGAPVLQTYGLTEACSQVATERLADADGTTAGPPLPGLEVRIVEGQIEVRGPTVAPQFPGWLATGDLGALDDRGRLTVFARRTDLIVSGGENVYPAELENILGGHPEVRELAVAARADPQWGQVPIALVVWKAEAPDRGSLEAWCRERLAGFKVPRGFISTAQLPRLANGKVDRSRVRALVA